MDNADAPLRLAEVWAFCHARLNENATALLAYSEGRDPAAAEATPYREAEFGLADIAFKRTLLEEHAPDVQAAAKCEEMTPMVVCRIDGDDCPVTQHLAALYDTHPDFEESWRP